MSMKFLFSTAVVSALMAGASPTLALPKATDKVNCASPAYSFLPSCDQPRRRSFLTAEEYEQLLQQRDTVRCNKARMACNARKDPRERAPCLAIVAEIC